MPRKGAFFIFCPQKIIIMMIPYYHSTSFPFNYGFVAFLCLQIVTTCHGFSRLPYSPSFLPRMIQRISTTPTVTTTKTSTRNHLAALKQPPSSDNDTSSEQSISSTPSSTTASTSSTSSSLSQTTATTTTTIITPPLPMVQRVYESFQWNYQGTSYNINYRVLGQGPPIMLIHGFGANINHFRYQFPTLASAGYRVYAVDLLGFGASDKPSQVPYSMELFAQLIQDFIQSQNHTPLEQEQQQQQENTSSSSSSSSSTSEPWIIAGNSIGGLCSLTVAQQLPTLVQGVVLFNCSGGMTGFRYEDVPIWVRPLLFVIQKVFIQGPIFGPRFFQNFRTRNNVESILSKQGVYGTNGVQNVDEELLEILLAPADDDGACDVFLAVFGGPPGPTPESILPTLQCPILALWGLDDPWTPYDAGAHPATGLSRYYFPQDNNSVEKPTQFWQLEVLPGVGHCPHDEVPNIVNEKMLTWMKNVKTWYSPPTKVETEHIPES